MTRPFVLYFVIGEESGDQLAAPLIDEMRGRFAQDALQLRGIAGPRMQARGMETLFDLADTAVMGFVPVIARLPLLLKRIRQTVDDILATEPDVVLLIDSPDFTHRVARKVRAANPAIKIVSWVSPTVWAWRPGRAARMRRYVDHLLAILPFEPVVHERLGGPACTYVGHPLASRMETFLPSDTARPLPQNGPIKLLVLPGSRMSEVRQHMPLLKECLTILRDDGHALEVILPAVSHLKDHIHAQISDWPVPVTVLEGEEAKLQAFRDAHAALAASGTVTLELSIAGVPMVIFYKPEWLVRLMSRFIKPPTIALANYILERASVREVLLDMLRPNTLAFQIRMMLRDTPERRAQIDSMEELRTLLRAGGASSAAMAADTILTIAARRP